MIKSINTGSTGGHLHVENGNTSLPYISSNSNNPLQGMLRLNNSNIEVFDGSSWMIISGGYPNVHLSGAAISALDWASKKMHEEQCMLELAKRHPGVADAVANLEKAMDQVKIMVALTEQDEKAV